MSFSESEDDTLYNQLCSMTQERLDKNRDQLIQDCEERAIEFPLVMEKINKAKELSAKNEVALLKSLASLTKFWFDELWNDSIRVEDVKEKVLEYLEQLYQNQPPEFVYYKTLFHLF